MNILLVEPEYRTTYVPLGLMKISTYHKGQGDTVKYVKGFNYFSSFEPDKIYITSLFTWYYDKYVETIRLYKQRYPKAEVLFGGIAASLLKRDFEEIGLEPHFGTLDGIDNLKPDYGLFPNIDYSIGYTTRSCIRKCPWCMTWRLEGEFKELPDWENMYDTTKENLVFFDNNFLASSKEHIQSVLNRCAELGKNIDFNQGIDARLFTEDIAKLFSKTKIKPLRFAFDTMDVDGEVQEAVEFAHKYGIQNISCYVLFNFTDTPQQLYYRVSQLVRLNVDAYPMRYQPLTAKVKDKFIGKHWNIQQLKNLRVILQSFFVNSVVGKGNSKDKDNHNWFQIFGNSEDEFMERINTYHENPDVIKVKRRVKQVSDNKGLVFGDFSEAEIAEVMDDYGGMIDRQGAIEILRRKNQA